MPCRYNINRDCYCCGNCTSSQSVDEDTLLEARWELEDAITDAIDSVAFKYNEIDSGTFEAWSKEIVNKL